MSRESNQPMSEDNENGNFLDDLSPEEQQALKQLAEKRANESVSRRDFGRAGLLAALGLTGAAGAGAGTAMAQESSTQETGTIGTDSNRVDVYGDTIFANELVGVSTGGGSSTAYISAGDSVSTINNATSSAGRVVFEAGNHYLSDRIDITSSDVQLVVLPGAHLKLADTASPTTISSNSGTAYTPVIYSNGNDRVSVRNLGTIDGNDTNHTNGVCTHIQSADIPAVAGPGGEFIDHASAVSMHDCTNGAILQIDGIANSAVQGSVWLEACRAMHLENIRCDGGEGIDLNGANEQIRINGVRCDNNGDDVLDINGAKNVHASGVCAGNNSTKLLTVTGTPPSSSSLTFSSASPFGYSKNIYVNGVQGTVSADAINFTNSGEYRGSIQVTGIDVISTGGNGVYASPSASGVWQGTLWLQGYAETQASSGADAFNLDGAGSGYSKSGLRLNIEAKGGGRHAVGIGEWSDVSGRIVAYGAGSNGVIMPPGGGISNINLEVHAWNNSGSGFRIGSSGATTSDITLQGHLRNNSYADVTLIETTDVWVAADWMTKAVNSPVRTVWNGLGLNSGDPNSTGDWNGNGREGVIVRDTTNANTHLYNNGVWSQIAST